MIALLFTAGALLRVALSCLQKSFWFDEWASIEVALEPWRQVIVQTGADTHPPLYFLLLHALGGLFGPADIVFRLPSLAAGILLIPAAYALAAELTDRKTARLTALFVSLSPYFIHLSREIRNHGMPAFYVALASWAYLRMMREPRRRVWPYLYMFTAAAGVYTDHLVWLWAAVIGAHHIWGLRQNRPGAKEHIVTQLLFIGLCLPAIGLMWFNTTANREAFAYEGIESYTVLTVIKQMGIVYWHIIAGPKYFMFYNKLLLGYLRHSTFFWASLYLVTAFFLLFARELFLKMKGTDRRNGLWWAGLTLMPVLLVAVLNPTRLETRYFSYLAPFFWILVSAALVKESRAVRGTLVALFIFVSAGNFWFMWNYPSDPYHREDYIAMSRFAAREAGPNDLIVVNGSKIFEYYRTALKLDVRSKCFSDISELNKESTKGYDRIFLLDGMVVTASDFYIIENIMKGLGFRIQGKELMFGGGPDTGLVDIFVRE